MKVKSIAECSKHSAILLTFIKVMGLENQFSVFLRAAVLHMFYTGFTVMVTYPHLINSCNFLSAGSMLANHSGYFDLLVQ